MMYAHINLVPSGETFAVEFVEFGSETIKESCGPLYYGDVAKSKLFLPTGYSWTSEDADWLNNQDWEIDWENTI